MFFGFVGVVLLVAVLALLGFAAVGRAIDRPAPGDRIVFTGWGGIVEREVFTELVREFERRNPDVRVEYRPVPRDYVTKLKLMFAGGTPPDVFYIPDGDFPAFAVAGRMLDLQRFVDASDVVREEEFWPSGLRRYRFDGARFGQGPLFALPKDIGPTAMFVNLDLFRERGVPPPPAGRALDWDEALDMWRRMTRDFDGDGRTDQWGTHGMVLEAAVWSHGGDLLSPDGRRFTMPDDPLALEAAQWVADLQSRHRVAPMERHQQAIPVDTMFLTGRMATFIGGRWNVPLFRNAEFDWDVVPVPVSPRTRRLAGWSGSVGLAVSATSRHPEASWRLVEFLAGPEGQAAQARTGFQIPNQRWLAETEAFTQPGERPRSPQVFAEAAAYQQAGPPTRTPSGEWMDALQRALGPAMRGEASVEDAVRRAAPEVQAALDRAWRGSSGER
jgi:multiple sugar transport system substrate-binding protein